MQYKIIKSNKIIITTWIGRLADSDLKDGYIRLYSDKEWNPDFNELADFRDADVTRITKIGLYAFADFTSKYEGENKKTAILVSNDLTFGLGRMYEIQATEIVKLFRDLGKALEWLEAPPDLLDQP